MGLNRKRHLGGVNGLNPVGFGKSIPGGVSEILTSLKFDGMETRLIIGADEYVDFPSFSLSGEFTIWFKVKTFRPYNASLNMFLTNNDNTNFIDIRSTLMRIRLSGTNTQISCSNIYDGLEHKIAFTRDATNTIKLYIDGVQQGVGLVNAASGTYSKISRYLSGNFALNGFMVGALAITDGYGATQTDITNLETQLPADILSNLIRDYDFNSLSQDSMELVDKVNVANNGTLTNFETIPEIWRDFEDPFPTITVDNNINIALAGQSNARSKVDETTKPVDLSTKYLNSAAYQYGIKSKMRFGTSGINAYRDLEGDYGVEFRITNNLQGTRNVTWLKYAEGGSSVGVNTGGQWAFNGMNTLGMIAEASNDGYIPEWLVWIQGESDATNSIDAAAHQTNVEATFAAFRTAWGAGLKIIIVKLFDFTGVGAFASDVQTAQVNIATAQANTYLVDPVAEGVVKPTDELDTLHYNALGIDKIAKACYTIINSNL